MNHDKILINVELYQKSFKLIAQLFETIPSLHSIRIRGANNCLIIINEGLIIRTIAGSLLPINLERDLQDLIRHDITKDEIMNIIQVKCSLTDEELAELFNKDNDYTITRADVVLDHQNQTL